MPAAENQRLFYRDKFRSLHYEAFQSWFEELVHALHPVGDFQTIRKTQGDGGLDGFVISSQQVYAVYAPARRKEDRDSETAAKIRSDFAKACSTLHGQLKAWVFVHNHPEGKLGHLGTIAISDLKSKNPSVEITVLSIDGLWEKLNALPDETLKHLFGEKDAGTTSALSQLEENIPPEIEALLDEACRVSREDQNGAGKAKYQEALKLAEQTKHEFACTKAKAGICNCLDTMGKNFLVKGEMQEAYAAFEEMLTLGRDLEQPETLVGYLKMVLRLYAMHGRRADAIRLLTEASELSAKHELHEDCADCILEKAELDADKEGQNARGEAAEAAIKFYRKALKTDGDKKHEARLNGKIGKAYQRLERLTEALVWLNEAKESHLAVGTVGTIYGAIECLNVIAEIKRKQSKPEEELAVYDQIVTIGEPEAMHLHVAAAENARGLLLMDMGRHPEAKRAFDKAEKLCRENPQFFKLAPFFAENLQRAQHRLKELLPPENDLWELVRELHELVAFFPEAKESYLPFWYWYRDPEIRSCVRASAGLKFLILENDVGEFLSAADQLSFISDLCLQAVSSRFAKSAEYWQQPDHVDRGCRDGKEGMDRKTMAGWDQIPFPPDKTVPSAVAIAVPEMRDGKIGVFKRGGHHSAYIGFEFFLISKVTGNKAYLITGKSRLLPEQAYDLMLGHSADEMRTRKLMFLSEERYFKGDKLAFDLHLSTTLGLIPVYTGRLPRSDDVEVVRGGQVELAFPLPPQKSKAVIQSKFAEVKRKLVRLLSLKDEEAVTALTEIAGQLDELRATTGSSECIRMTAFMLRFPVHSAMQTHLAVVRHSG